MGCGKRDMTPAELAARPKTGTGSKTTLIEDPGVLDATAKTYIREKNMERRSGRSLNVESNARPLTWGKAIEKRLFDVMGTEYILCSDKTLEHPNIPFWKGSPDGRKEDEGITVVEMKCPITMKSFFDLVDPLYDGFEGIIAMNMIRNGYTDKAGNEIPAHPDGEKYYWQVVSNAVLTGAKYGELIVYCPFKSELEEIRDFIRNPDNFDGDNARFVWINYAMDRSCS